MMAVVSMSFVVTVLVVMTGFHPSEGRVDYKCVYGPMMSVTDAGREVYFCATEMSPPFLQRGEYILARDATGTCYECLCEDELGMACCETQRCVEGVMP